MKVPVIPLAKSKQQQMEDKNEDKFFKNCLIIGLIFVVMGIVLLEIVHFKNPILYENIRMGLPLIVVFGIITFVIIFILIKSVATTFRKFFYKKEKR